MAPLLKVAGVWVVEVVVVLLVVPHVHVQAVVLVCAFCEIFSVWPARMFKHAGVGMCLSICGKSIVPYQWSGLVVGTVEVVPVQHLGDESLVCDSGACCRCWGR